MSNGIARFVAFLILVSATASFMVGSSTLFEQIVKAQNTTTNMTGSVGNMSGNLPPPAAPSSTEMKEKFDNSARQGGTICRTSTC